MDSRRPKVLLWVVSAMAVAIVAYGAWWYFRPGGAAVTPSRHEFPIRGIDISAHNGPVDFEAMTVDSIDFVVIKASEGTSFKDPAFNANYRAARRAGMKVGAYHFFRFDAPGYMQALNFLHSVRGKHLDLPAVIDIEEWTNPTDRTAATVVKQLKALIDCLEDAGFKVMLYSNKDGFTRYINGSLETYPLWIASLSSRPDSGWTVWQYTHRGKVGGIDGAVDINAFNGSREDWDDWLNEMAAQTQ